MKKKNKYTVEYGEDYIAILWNGVEALYWHESEWQADSQVVFSICNAVQLAESGRLSLPKIKRGIPQ